MLAADATQRILIVDPNPGDVEPLRERLAALGFAIHQETDGNQALGSLLDRPPCLVIMDWNMPGFAALELIRRVRKIPGPRAVRLIIVSALCGESDVVTGLESGADDYIAKPYSPREAVARVVSVLRSRTRLETGAALNFDELELDSATNRVSARGKLLNLRGAEYRLLQFLMSHAGRTFSRGQLLANVWGKDVGVDVRTVDVNVQRLRKVLAEPGYDDYIQTVRGFGYRFSVPASPASPARSPDPG